MSHSVAASGGVRQMFRIGAAAAGVALLLVAATASTGTAAAAVDPMRQADPAPRFDDLPDVAPARGGLLPVPSGTGDAGVSAVRGGIRVPRVPRVTGVQCVKQCISSRKATPGAVVRVSGGYLNGVTEVFFRGRRHWIRKKPIARQAAAVRVEVPKRATRGQVWVIDRFGVRSNRSPRALGIGSVNEIPREVFPIRGPFNFGSSGSRFGAGRPGHIHQGQDLGSPCGTRLVSARKGTVVYNGYQAGGAGNYVVIRNSGTNTSFVYMHMLRRSGLRVGEGVGAGTSIGRVGNTGASFGCHLHFEYWVGSWQAGGKPVDPLGYLKSLLR
ncbi:MAG: M23 family metallopeptidase [Solirubrobacterales bacterium]|nr:M23 family metallopeptidase [Solirubrobacterales bacterium]